MSFVERSIIVCPYLGGSTIGGSTVYLLSTHLPTAMLPTPAVFYLVSLLQAAWREQPYPGSPNVLCAAVRKRTLLISLIQLALLVLCFEHTTQELVH